jgi:raffinose/stachyose/melibiose transport system substrate-binding protein
MKKNQALLKILGTFCLISLLVACGTATPAATTAPVATDTVAGAAAKTVAPTVTVAPAPVTLTYLADDSEVTQSIVHALAKAYMALHPNVTITIENRPQGGEGDNVVKTRLATDDMTDIFFYNAGSLLQALHPADTLVDLTGQPCMANVVDSFLPAVTQNGKVYGVPTGTAMGGGILYNKKIYSQLGLKVPKTWAEFEANNDAIKAAGIAPVIATFADTWTSQLFVLADYYNVQQANPGWDVLYTTNKAKYATTPAAMAGFVYLREGFDKGWWQKDYATTKFEQGLKLLADGKGAHYPMLSFALPTIAANSPEAINDIGFFGQPGTDAANAGATIWMPAGTYIPKTSKNIDAAKEFLAFIASTAGTDAQTAALQPGGPYMVKGAKLPDTVMPAVKDIAAYIDSGKSYPALEFVSPIKGPTLEQLCVAVGSGQMTPEAAAAAYDKDVEKQAQQLGLPGW